MYNLCTKQRKGSQEQKVNTAENAQQRILLYRFFSVCKNSYSDKSLGPSHDGADRKIEYTDLGTFYEMILQVLVKKQNNIVLRFQLIAGKARRQKI